MPTSDHIHVMPTIAVAAQLDPPRGWSRASSEPEATSWGGSFGPDAESARDPAAAVIEQYADRWPPITSATRGPASGWAA